MSEQSFSSESDAELLDDREQSSGDEDFDQDDQDHASVKRLRGVGDDIYNAEELHERLEDIMWEGASFLDTYTMEGQSAEAVPDIEDDLQRELTFYNQALEATRQAVAKLEEAKVAWRRPPDYYAEMVKSDGHMSRIKEQLVYEQQQIEQADERRKQREAKKHNKQVQAERQKEKAQAKKQSIDTVTKLRRNRQKSGFAGELDMDAELARMEKPKHAGARRIFEGSRGVNKKRETKNTKYGFGGRKRLGKQNDASSAANMESYKPGKRKAGKPQRPGKSKRQAMRK